MKLALNMLMLVITAGASVLLDPAVARAATITYAYTGTVTTVSSPLGGTFAVGDTFTGTFVLDTEATANGGCTGACVFYLSPLQTYSATVGSYGFSGVAYEVLAEVGGQDTWAFGAGYYGTVSGPAVNGLTPWHFSLQLSDPSGAALTGLSLVPPVLSDYSIATFRLAFDDFPTPSLSGTIASLSVVEPTTPTPPAVPEPASLALLATGLAGLAASRTRRSK